MSENPSEVLFDDRAQFKLDVGIVELRCLVPFEFGIPAQIDGQHALVEESAAQAIFGAGVPVAVATG